MAFVTLLRPDFLLFFFLEEKSIHSSSSINLGVVAQQHFDGQFLSFDDDWELPILERGVGRPRIGDGRVETCATEQSPHTGCTISTPFLTAANSHTATG